MARSLLLVSGSHGPLSLASILGYTRPRLRNQITVIHLIIHHLQNSLWNSILMDHTFETSSATLPLYPQIPNFIHPSKLATIFLGILWYSSLLQ
ncbi:hypothetical protein EDB92DRAFT_1633676 [Lactarius akahatsu]|uniref:Uncharacterized protein n=1 Tax=Lactarius akahatsu TaxID=416441 RepID=A0AAD4L6R4_9AGAM|nr:hypothetical protein EDB92DRAFT_1633676 [Lactarius akahatsu]